MEEEKGQIMYECMKNFECIYKRKYSKSSYCENIGLCMWQNRHRKLVWSENYDCYMPISDKTDKTRRKRNG